MREKSRPNIIVVFADDISARELPLYGSSVWSPPTGGDTRNAKYRAATPVLDRLANEGCWISTAWASVVCSPSRAMMMTGRYAHLHKWWGNKSKGKYVDEQGSEVTWPLYMSSPLQIGHVAQRAGYSTYWAGKTQMAGDLTEFGFDRGCFTPGGLDEKDNPYTDFKHVVRKTNGQRQLINLDTKLPVQTYQQHGWYWFPHVRLMNHGAKEFQWWPNTGDSKTQFGVETYGPDVELDFIFDFMERQVAEDKPFFVYHTSHLGHDAFDWLNPNSKSKWPGTPVVNWDGEKYTRIDPKITGDEGEYDTHGTVTPPGIHNHINYLDYQAWLYQKKLDELGIVDNTIFVFCADNGTSGYGKNSPDRQKGTHVPLIISGPGLTKQGKQDVLMNMCDLLPTIAELTGVEIPSDYEINGESLVPFLFSDQAEHRDWIYGYLDDKQIIRGKKVLRDGRGKWWDVENTPDDLISFPRIENWEQVSEAHRQERDELIAILPRFDQANHGKHGPGVASEKTESERNASKKTDAGIWQEVFRDDFEGRSQIGEDYFTGRGHADGWSVENGVLVGRQVREDHGATIRTDLDFGDVDIEFDFQVVGGKSFNLVIDDVKESSVHAGHICRASVYARAIRIADDKVGAMNLAVRKQRKDEGLSEEEAEKLQHLLDETQASRKATIKPSEWHTMRVRLRGDVMKAFLDGELVTSLRSPGFAHPTKTKFGFTVNGDHFEFDNLRVRKPL
ncbi:MAG: sulfatase-like hydrolase/transferase [Planctomycetota bacterium]